MTDTTAIQLTRVTNTFGGVRAIHDVSLTAKDGEFVGLIGPNGAGKTTLLNIITGTVRPDVGSIIAFDQDITGKSPARIARLGVGRTFQLVQLFDSLTVLENVAVVFMTVERSKRRARADALAVLDELGIADLADNIPTELPFAIRRKVELARAMALRPRILLSDEVMAGLDDDEIDDMAALLQQRADTGVCVIAVEHNLDFVMNNCSRVVVLHQGEVLASGLPQEVAEDPAVVEAYVGSWVRGDDT